MGDYDKPTKTWPCQDCGETVERYRGEGDKMCQCGAWYNAGGQRLRDDWMELPEWKYDNGYDY